MNFINDPFRILKEIIADDYPEVECEVYIGEQFVDGKETFGCTIFPEEEGEKITVEIHYSLSIENATEVLAHELAHVIAGQEAEHNEEWEKAFTDLNNKFTDKLISL